jgi:putative endonuclease
MHYVYIVECVDGTLYTGYTTNIEKRVEAHNGVSGAKYTRSRQPVRLAYSEEFASKSDALKREAQIKRLSHNAKLSLLTATKGSIPKPN